MITPILPVTIARSERNLKREIPPQITIVLALLFMTLAVGLGIYYYAVTLQAQNDEQSAAMKVMKASQSDNSTSSDNTSDWQTYNGTGFTFQYPSDWEIKPTDALVQTTPDNGSTQSLEICPANASCDVLSITTFSSVDSTMSLEDFGKQHYDGITLKEIVVGNNIQALEVMKVDATSEGNGTDNPIIVRSPNGDILIFALESPVSDQYKDIYNQIIASFQFTN